MALFLRAHERRKHGKVHTYWSLAENRRCGDGRVVQRQVLYLGALSRSQWWKGVVERGRGKGSRGKGERSGKGSEMTIGVFSQ